MVLQPGQCESTFIILTTQFRKCKHGINLVEKIQEKIWEHFVGIDIQSNPLTVQNFLFQLVS